MNTLLFIMPTSILRVISFFLTFCMLADSQWVNALETYNAKPVQVNNRAFVEQAINFPSGLFGHPGPFSKSSWQLARLIMKTSYISLGVKFQSDKNTDRLPDTSQVATTFFERLNPSRWWDKKIIHFFSYDVENPDRAIRRFASLLEWRSVLTAAFSYRTFEWFLGNHPTVFKNDAAERRQGLSQIANNIRKTLAWNSVASVMLISGGFVLNLEAQLLGSLMMATGVALALMAPGATIYQSIVGHWQYNETAQAPLIAGLFRSSYLGVDGDDEDDGKDQTAIDYDKQRLEVNYGFLPPDHPISIYLDQLMEEILPGTSIQERPLLHVTARHGQEANAWVYSDGSIVLTLELLEKLDTKEEIQAVLAHELIHLDRKHFKRVRDATRLGAIRHVLGLRRYNEYEADIAGLMLLIDAGVNIQGMISVRKKLNSGGWSSTYGSGDDLPANLQTITFFADIANLSREMTPLPAEILKSRLALIEKGRVDSAVSRSTSQKTRIAVIQSADWPLFLAIARTPRRNIAAADQKALYRRFDALCLQSFGTLPMEQQEIARKFLMTIIKMPDSRREAHLEKILTAYGLESADPENEMLDASERFDRAVQRVPLDRMATLITHVVDQTRLYLSPADLGVYAETVFEVLRRESVYETPDGGFDSQRYLHDAGQFLRSLDESCSSHLLSGQPDKASWVRIVIGGLEELSLLGKTDSGDLTVFFSQLRNEIQLGMSLAIATFNLALNENAAIQPQDREACRQTMRRVGLLPRIVSVPSDDPHKQVKQSFSRIARMIGSESEENEFAARFTSKRYDDQDRVVAMARTFPPQELVFGLHAVLEDDTEYQRGGVVYGKLFSDILFYLFNIFLNGDSSINEIETVVRVLQTSAPSPKAYRDTVTSLSERLTYLVGHGDPRTKTKLKLSMGDMQRLRTLMNDFEGADQQFGLKRQVKLVPLDMNESDSFPFLAFEALGRTLATVSTPEEYFSLLEAHLHEWPLVSLWAFRNRENADLLNPVRKQMNAIYTRGKAFLEKQSGAKKESWRMALSFFNSDFFERKVIQENFLRKAIENLNFKEGMDLIFESYKLNRPEGLGQAIDYLIEKKASTNEDFEDLLKHLPDLLRWDNSGLQAAMGTWVIGEGVSELFFKDQETLLLQLLSTGEGDEAFKEYWFPKWFRLYSPWIGLDEASAIVTHAASLDNIGIAIHQNAEETLHSEFKDWAYDTPNVLDVFYGRSNESVVSYYPLEELLNSFYRMDEAGRLILLRKLLISKGGVLTTLKGREHLMDRFLKQSLDDTQDSKTANILRDIVRAVIRVGNQDRLYFALSNMLKDRIAIRPENPSSWDDRIRLQAETSYKTMLSKIHPGDRHWATENKEFIVEMLAIRIKRWVLGPEAYQQEVYKTVGQGKSAPQASQKLSGIKRMSPLEFSVEVGKQFQSPGVRGLQLMRQFAKLPDSYRKVFNQACDDMTGQSRLSAYMTVKRDAPELYKKIRRWGQRVGGGSLFTVYEADVDDDGQIQTEALRILNPNARYHKDYSIELIRDALGDLSKDKLYQPFIPMIEDVSDWIDGDIVDANFLAEDQQFGKDGLHHGFRPPEWNGKGAGYNIYVPRTYFTPKMTVRRETFIKTGKNLTDMTALSGPRKREIVSLLVRDYDRQIIGENPFGNSLVWSDVQPGNVRVTSDHQVVLLDRNFYLKLTVQDKMMLHMMVQNRDNASALVSGFVKYLLSQPANQHLQDRYRGVELEILTRQITNRLSLSGVNLKTLEETILDAFVELRAQGLIIPLRITLLLKNLISLNQLCREVGLGSLENARTYNPDQDPGDGKIENNPEAPLPTIKQRRNRKGNDELIKAA